MFFQSFSQSFDLSFPVCICACVAQVSLSRNGITDTGAAAIAHALTANSSTLRDIKARVR